GNLTDLQSGQIIRETLTPAFKSNNYYSGIDLALNQIMDITQGEDVIINNNSNTNSKSLSSNKSLFIIGIIILQFLSSWLRKSKSYWLGGVLGLIAGIIIGLVKASFSSGIIFAIILGLGGLLFDYIISKNPKGGGKSGGIFFGGGGSGFGGGSSGGFGGGRSGGGGSSGGW
ncbi:hypothetical protein K8R66_01075, partial [bacterium]|nr:hypothetical protein [bacterium]